MLLPIFCSEITISSVEFSLRYRPGPQTIMVRPRASDRNMTIAIRFAKMLTSFKEKADLQDTPVPLIGLGSIHHFLSLALPAIARDKREISPKNRAGVTAVELNKALKVTGMNYSRRYLLIACHLLKMKNKIDFISQNHKFWRGIYPFTGKPICCTQYAII